MIVRADIKLHSTWCFSASVLMCALMFGEVSSHAQARSHRSATATKPEPQPTGPTVVFDTTLGRITCKLFSKEAPVTSANFVDLATGKKEWVDAATGSATHAKPFYDGVAFNGISDGIIAGDRMGGGKGVAGSPFAAEKSGIGFERGGRLVMAPVPSVEKSAPAMTNSSIFFITAHADLEFTRRGGTVFGQCDDASIPVIGDLAHALLSVDNHPEKPVAINRVSVLKAGAALPPVAEQVPPASVTPQPVPMPTALVPSPEPKGPTAVIDVVLNAKTRGQLTCRLFQDEAPIGTANFIGLVNGTKDWKSPSTHALMHGKRFYDGLHFRRVIPDFMIQNSDMPGDLDGGADIGFKFANETLPELTFDRPGRLAYANSGPGTNQSEFFITEHPNHRLDGNYTIFGQCDDASVKLVEEIARVPRDEHNRPITPVMIQRISIAAAK